MTDRTSEYSPINTPLSTNHSPKGYHQFFHLMPIVLLLWLYLFIRVHAIDTLPYFVDELRHVGRSNVVWSFSDIDVSTTPHKFFLYYWLGLFDLPLHLPGWLARIAVGVFCLIGAASTYALGRRLFSQTVGLLSIFFLSLFPFMFFYERLALSDPLTSSLVALLAWWSLVVAYHPTRRHAIILGIIITLMLAAKLLAVPLMLLTATAILFLGPKRLVLGKNIKKQVQDILRHYRLPALTAIAIVGTVWGLILIFYAIRTDFGQKQDVSPIINSYLLWPAGYSNNLQRIDEAMTYLWGIVLTIVVGVAIIGLLFRHTRQFLYLASGIIPLWWALVAIAGQLSTRYLTLAGHLWVVLIVAGLVSTEDFLKSRISMPALKSPRFRYAFLSSTVLVIWCLGFGGRFWQTLITDPTQLELPPRDQHEYFRNQTGYALQDVLKDVADLPTISANSDYPILVGLVRNCSFLPHYIPENVHVNVKCSVYSYFHRDEWPPIEKRMQHLNKMLDTYGSVYLVMEIFEADPKSPLIDMDMVNGELDYQRTYERPFDGIPVELYIVHPSENDNLSMSN